MNLVEFGKCGYIFQVNPYPALIKASVGDRKTINGRSYKLNENHRWEKDEAIDGQLSLFGMPVIQDEQPNKATSHQYVENRVLKDIRREYYGKPSAEEIKEQELYADHPGIAWEEGTYQTWMDLYREGISGFGDRIKDYYIRRLREDGHADGPFPAGWKVAFESADFDLLQDYARRRAETDERPSFADKATQILAEVIDKEVGFWQGEIELNDYEEDDQKYLESKIRRLTEPKSPEKFKASIRKVITEGEQFNVLEDLTIHQLERADWDEIGKKVTKLLKLDEAFRYEQSTGRHGFSPLTDKPYKSFYQETKELFASTMSYLLRMNDSSSASLNWMLNTSQRSRDYRDFFEMFPEEESKIQAIVNSGKSNPELISWLSNWAA